jgi:hypothetical protein
MFEDRVRIECCSRVLSVQSEVWSKSKKSGVCGVD